MRTKSIPITGNRLRATALLLCCLTLMLTMACGRESTPTQTLEELAESTRSGTPATGRTPTAEATSSADGEDREAPSGETQEAGEEYEDGEGHYLEHIHEIWHHSPSVEEQILTSSTIVRATLQSATADAEIIPNESGQGSKYRPIQRLKFTVHEYLKGSGPDQAEIIVYGKDTYPGKAATKEIAQNAIDDRVTTWDRLEGVLFLNPTAPPQDGTQQSGGTETGGTFEFTLSNPVVQSEWAYSVDTLSRAWLPADGSEIQPQQSDQGETSRPNVPANSFVTDGSQEQAPTIQLSELRSKIAEITAMVNKNPSQEYQRCVTRRITRERYYRDEPIIAWKEEDYIESGSAPGNTIHTSEYTSGDPEYYIPWINGPDAELFKTSIMDDDDDPTNGYEYALTIARPLPAGQYQVFQHMQHYANVICDHWPDNVYFDWTITVAALEGTRHEALFDPAAAGSATGYDGSSGVLDPSGFTMGDTAVTITKLLWQNSTVTLEMSPHQPLSGRKLDFIGMDGTVSLTLNTSDAVDDDTGTLTWSVPSQPWASGDQLMLRIRKAQPPPSLTPVP